MAAPVLKFGTAQNWRVGAPALFNRNGTWVEARVADLKSGSANTDTHGSLAVLLRYKNASGETRKKWQSFAVAYE
jgi:hypothetical protein